MEFQAERVWRRLATSGAGPADRLSLFMAVPTIYSKLLHAWDREEDAAVRQVGPTWLGVRQARSHPFASLLALAV